MADFKLESLVLGAIGTNVYFLKNEESSQILIVDPADGADEIEAEVSAMDGQPAAILLTHGHHDHIGAADEIRQYYKIPVYCDAAEEDLLADPYKNLSGSWTGKGITLTADQTAVDGQELDLAGFRFKVLHTPGHTMGSCCYYFPQEKLLFSGDTLFRMSYGRTDLPTGSESAIEESVRRILTEIPSDVRVLPGHMGETKIAVEKVYNPLA